MGHSNNICASSDCTGTVKQHSGQLFLVCGRPLIVSFVAVVGATRTGGVQWSRVRVGVELTAHVKV